MRKEYHIRLTQDRENFGLKNWSLEGRITKAFHDLCGWYIMFETSDGLTAMIGTDGILQMMTPQLGNMIDLKGDLYKFEWWVEENPDIGYPIHF